MKKSMIILAIVLVLSTVGFAFGSIANVNIQDIVSRFSDVSENHWFAKTVATLVERGGIDGYTDGTFKPQREITQGEFIKTVVGSLHQELPLAKDGHWAMNYIRRAVELGYIEEGEYPEANLNNIINRYQMAKIIVNAAEAQGETFMENPSSYIERIKDYNSIPVGYKELVLKAYTQGLLGGYPDGEFKGTRGLTRAEAATAIVRIFDAEARLEVAAISDGDVEVIEGITFNRETDINTDRNNPMKLDKQEEFVLLFLESVKFYKEDGNNYISGYVPNLPEGFEWAITIDINYANSIYDYFSTNEVSERRSARLYRGETFNFELIGSKSSIDNLKVTCFIKNINNNSEDGRFFMYYPEKELSKYNHINKQLLEFDWEEMFQW